MAIAPPLPSAYRDQNYCVQHHAETCRAIRKHADWVKNIPRTVNTYVQALGSEPLDYSPVQYTLGNAEVYRVTLFIPCKPAITIIGDGLRVDRAQKTAALNALVELYERGLIDDRGLPKPDRLQDSRETSASQKDPVRSASQKDPVRSAMMLNDSSGAKTPLASRELPLDSSFEQSYQTTLPTKEDYTRFQLDTSFKTTLPPSSTRDPLAISSAGARQASPDPTVTKSDSLARQPSPALSIAGTDSPYTERRAKEIRQGKARAVEIAQNVESEEEYETDEESLSDLQITPTPVRPVTCAKVPAAVPTVNGMDRSRRSPRPYSSHQSFLEPPTEQPSPESSPPSVGLILQPNGIVTETVKNDEAKSQTASKSSTASAQPAFGAKAPGRHEISLESARGFLDYCCKHQGYKKPKLEYRQSISNGKEVHQALLSINDGAMGKAEGCNMKEATSLAYIEAALWMARWTPETWAEYLVEDTKAKQADARATTISKNFPGADYVPAIELKFSDRLDEQLREFIWSARESELHKKALESQKKTQEAVRKAKEERARRVQAGQMGHHEATDKGRRNGAGGYVYEDPMREDHYRRKSRELQDRQDAYKTNLRQAHMRSTRAALPVSNHTQELLDRIDANPVLVVMAATGSGKTTQIPQIILDSYISRGEGAQCNVVCTQPRRLAAISVAQRVARERNESIGQSVGYQVRFENMPPQQDGSILFCTTGIFLKRMQAGLEDVAAGSSTSSFLDDITHVVVDEVHERDIDVDLLLFILRRTLIERRRAGKPSFKVILMSATIDPTLFTEYFEPCSEGKPASAVEIPGRSFPVQRHYLNEINTSLEQSLRMYPHSGWVFNDKDVAAYLAREMRDLLDSVAASRTEDDLKFPIALVALIIAFVARKTVHNRDGHILVFLPGLDEIKSVQKALLQISQPLLDVNFANYEMHILHSEVPVAEQQLVFEPAPPNTQRIILSTNISETSVTIPDVVYVVDAGKCKEKRFDPERHLSSLVSAFTGTSNMSQRAGRAGRHRPGHYYSLVSDSRLQVLPVNQTVEMKRLELSNVVMHVKGLGLPMEVEDVLDDCIEPPGRERVLAAIKALERVGALDINRNLTSLGKILLQLPVEAAIGRLCLLGCFFNCIDQVITIAAILTNRDPFIAPLEKRAEANAAKKRFCPPGFTSDILATLRAYNEWSSIPEFGRQRDLCQENFLSLPTLKLMSRIRDQLLNSLDRAGVFALSYSGELRRTSSNQVVLPQWLNANGESLPLLTALIAGTLAPGFAVRKTAVLLRTPTDASATLHASSIVGTARNKTLITRAVKHDMYAYAEASRNASKGGGNQGNGMKQNSQLRGVTFVDPLGVLLFGIHTLENSRQGFMCDEWLPLKGNVALLDDLERLKDVLSLSLLRAFEGVGAAMMVRSRSGFNGCSAGEFTMSNEFDVEDDRATPSMSEQEMRDFESLARILINILNLHALDNGLPMSHEIGRYLSSEEEFISNQYERRRPTGSSAVPTAKAKAPAASYGAWDEWGQTAASVRLPQDTPQVSSGSAPPEALTKKVMPTQQARQTMPTAPVIPPHPASPVAEQSGQAVETATADGWASWNASSVKNDAFEKRSAMTKSAFEESRHTFRQSNVQLQAAQLANGDRQPPVSDTGVSQVSSTSSEPKKASKSRWLGAGNVEKVRKEEDTEGWREYRTSQMLPAERSSSPIMSPNRGPIPAWKAAVIVDKPTQSEPPYKNVATGGWTTGWGPYQVRNPRLASSHSSSGGPGRPPPGPSPLRQAPSLLDRSSWPTASGRVDMSAPAPAPGASLEHQQPAHPAEPAAQASASQQTSQSGDWDSWKPGSSGQSGEAAFRNRAALSDACYMHQTYVSSSVCPEGWQRNRPFAKNDTPDASTFSHNSYTGAPQSSTPPRYADSRPDAAANVGFTAQRKPSPPSAPALVPTAASAPAAEADGWTSWNPKQDAAREGQANYQRRAAMAEGRMQAPVRQAQEYTRPPSPRRIPSPAPAHRAPSHIVHPTPTVPPSTVKINVGTEDGWNNYKPAVPAEQEGAQAYARRQAMNRAYVPASQAQPSPSAASGSSTSSIALQKPGEARPPRTLSIVGRAKRDEERDAGIHKGRNILQPNRLERALPDIQEGLRKLRVSDSPAPEPIARGVDARNGDATLSHAHVDTRPQAGDQSTNNGPVLGSYQVPLSSIAAASSGTRPSTHARSRSAISAFESDGSSTDSFVSRTTQATHLTHNRQPIAVGAGASRYRRGAQ